MKTGPLVMVKHRVSGWVPATVVPCYQANWYYPYWPRPKDMWQPLWVNSEMIGWIKRPRKRHESTSM